MYYLIRLSRNSVDLKVCFTFFFTFFSFKALDRAPNQSRKRPFPPVVDRGIERAMQAGITRGQRYGGFVVAQSTEEFISKRATRRGRYSQIGGIWYLIDVLRFCTSHICAAKGNT